MSNDRATPPSVRFVKKIFRVIYDMTKAKMAKYIDFRSDVSNAEEESDFLSFLTELERVDND